MSAPVTFSHKASMASKHVLIVILALATSACAATTSQHGGTIDALRRRAAEAPRDRDAQRALALAELFSWEGDPKRIDAQLERALALDAASARLWLAAGFHHDAHGRPEAAFDAYLRALTVAVESSPEREPLAPYITELSAHALGGVDGGVVGYIERIEKEITPLLNDPRLAMPARAELGALLIDLQYRRGDRPAAQAIAAQLGCVAEGRAAGPFGPRDLLGFDQEYGGITPGAALAAQYDLGAGRGVRPTREIGPRGCALHLGGGPLAVGGTTYLQSTLQVATTGKHILRVESPNNFELRVDGKSIARIDRRAHAHANTLYFPIELTAGAHELLVKVTTRHPNPLLSVALAPARPSDAVAITLPFSREKEQGFGRYLRASIAFGRGDVVEARLAVRGVEATPNAAALLLLQRASIMLSDPLMPGQLAQDEARRLLEQALNRDPNLWSPIAQLAHMAANNGRTKEAIAVLRDAVQKFPEVPALRLSLAGMLQDESWDAEADRVIAATRKLVPDACGPIAAELEALQARDREQAATPLVEKVMACEARGNARYSLFLRQRRFDEARVELERLAALDPPQASFAWTLARLELAKSRRDEAEIDKQIAELRRVYPQTSSALVDQIDRLAAKGDAAGALATLNAAIAAEPTALSGVRRLAPLVGGEAVLQKYRKDGPQAIAAFEKSGRTYDAPQVLVLDYMAAEIQPDGSSIELIHTVQRAQSDEAVNELAEVSVPEGAHVLTLRVIKPDGRKLEADAIAGKDTVSLPSMAVGDYVEIEMLQHRDPPDAFPNGYVGERFYFQSYEIPFDHSEMVVVLPASMPYAVDPRGNAPKTEETVTADKRVLRFLVQNSAPLQPEPMSVTPREFLPSVRVGYHVPWPELVESIREALIDRDVYDPEIAGQVARVVGDAAPADYRTRAKRLYDWVLAEVENDDDLLSQGAVMLRSGSGNRARVLHYLLKLAGVPARLALVRSAMSDSTKTDMADGETYEHLLVMFEDAKGPVWLFTAERWAPFGFVPSLLAGQPAMFLSGEPATAMLPPRDGSLDSRDVELDVALNESGGAEITYVETVRGGGAIGWRNQLESIPEAELERRFEEEYAGRLVPGAQLKSLAIEGREQDSDTLRIAMTIEVARFGRRVDGGIALPSLVTSQLSATYARIAARTTTQLISSPVYNHVVMRLRAPKNGKLPVAPGKVALQASIPGQPSFALKSQVGDGTLTLERAIAMPVMRIVPKDYAAFTQFCRAVDAAEAQELVVRMP
jgi:tetratricopeptide (TPR) repeat protein